MARLTEFTTDQLARIYEQHVAKGFFQTHREQIEGTIRRLGAVQYDLWLPETHTLPLIINPSEQIQGIIYGRYKQTTATGKTLVGRGVLVATDQRALLIDKKPFFVSCDQITYTGLSAVDYRRVSLIGTVTLHSRAGDISIRTFNQPCARHFTQAVEKHLFEDQTLGAVVSAQV